MRKGCVLMLMMIACFLTGGCSAKDVEAQAYAVSLGVDLTGEGAIEVSVQVPALNQSGSSESGDDSGGESGGGGKGYTFSAASGRTLTGALEMLNASIPRELNLTGVKSIVVSEELARSDRFAEVLEEMALAYRVYGAAEMMVCQGRASEFIQNQQAVIGLRLSESTTVALEHYQENGYIPSAKAADIYYISRSFYGDPAAILAASSRGETEQTAGNGDDSYAGSLPSSGADKNQYFGSALLSEGRMVGTLTGMQTQLLNVLLGDLKYFSWIVEETPVRINVSGGPKVKVDLSGSAPVISVEMTLNMMDSQAKLDPETLRAELVRRLDELTQYCQACGCDPFRYAETAVRQFMTVEEWLSYDWRTRFPQAQIRYDIEVRAIEL